MPILTAALWLFGDAELLRSGLPWMLFDPEDVLFEEGKLGGTVRFLGLAICMIPGAIVMAGARHLRQLVAGFAELRFFTADAIRHLRRFTATILGFGIAKPLACMLLTVATSFQNSPGNRVLSFGLADSDVFAIFVGTVLLVIAWVMEQGREIADENQQII